MKAIRFSSLTLLAVLLWFSFSQPLSHAQTNGQRAGNITFVTTLPVTCRPANGIIYGKIGNPVEYSICVANNTYQRIDNVATTAPLIAQHSPASVIAGASAFTLTINGINFAPGAVVNWNGTTRTTTYVSSTQVTAAITAPDVATLGAASVSVTSGGNTTNAVTVVIQNDTPKFSSETYDASPSILSPSRVVTELNDGLQATEDQDEPATRLKTKGVPTGCANFITDYGGNPDDSQTTGNISIGTTSLVVASLLNFKPGQYVAVTGVGVGGEPLIAKILRLKRSTKTLTLDTIAAGNGTGVNVRADNRIPLQNALDVLGKGICRTPGYFWVYNSLTNPVTLRANSEGQPIILRGMGDNQTQFKFWGEGDALAAIQGANYDNIVIEDLALFTSVATTKGWGINLAGANVVNYPRLRNVRIYGFRGGVYCSNCQGGTIHDNVFRANKHAQLVLASDESIWTSGMEPNVVNIYSNQFDFQPDPMTDNDAALTGLSAAANSNVITASTPLFNADHRGKIIRIFGAGTTGGDIIGLIQSVDSATQITISSKVNKVGAISGKTGTIFRTPYAGAYFLRSNFTTFSSNIFQGNYGLSTRDVSSVVVEGSTSWQAINHYSEENGGSAGAHFKFIDTTNALIRGFKTNSQGACDGSKHCWDLIGVNAKGTKIEGAAGSLSILHYNLDANSDVTVDHSTLGNPDFASETGPQRVTYGDNVRYAQWGDVNRGTATLYDATYGEQRVTNPRFDQGLTGWTVDTVGGVTARTDGADRYKNYAKIDTTGLATGSTTSILSQVVSIPDGEESQHYVLAFDYRVDSIPVGSDGNYKFEISVIPSAGGTGYNYPLDFRWQVRGDNSTGYPLGRWLRAQFNLKTAAGTSRNFKIEFRARPGALNPIVSVTNVRMMPGKHASFSNDQPITELKGGRIDSAAAITIANGAGGGVRTACVDNNGTLNTFGCGAGGGGGALTLNGQSGTNQSFAKTDDTNVTLTINSAADTHTFGLGWTGALAKARQHAATVYTDQANTFGAFAQTFKAGGNFLVVDPTDATKRIQFDVSNVATATTRTVNVPNANSTTVQADTGAANQFLTAISSQGVVSKAQPNFTNMAGTATAGQLPATTVNSVVNDTNVTGSISAQALTLSWTGTLAKARQNAATAYTDQANTFGAFAQSFAAATSLTVPSAAGAAPTASGQVAYDTTSNTLEAGVNGANKTVLFTDGNGSNLTALNASNLGSGTVPLTRLANITDNEISASANIAISKLATLAASRAMVSNGGGTISTSAVVDSNELDYLDGVTSPLQNQLDNKVGFGDLGSTLTFSTTVDVNQAAAFNFTGLHTHSMSTTPVNALTISHQSRTTDGIRDSHYLRLSATGRASAVNTTGDWRVFARAVDAVGTANLVFRGGVNDASYADALTLTQGGILGLTSVTNSSPANGQFWYDSTSPANYYGVLGGAAKAFLLTDPAGTNYNEGGQAAQGATALELVLATGSSASPVSSALPSISIQRVDNTNLNTTIIPYQFSTWKKSGNGDTYAIHSFIRNESATARDSVPVTGSVYASPSTVSVVNQTNYGLWGRAERSTPTNGTAPGVRIVGAELDVVNSTNIDCGATDSDLNACIALAIVGTGYQSNGSTDPTTTARNTYGIAFQTGNANNKGSFFTGINFNANTVINYGIDFKNLGTAPIAPIRFANATYTAWRNAADNGNILAFGVDSSNTTRIRGDAATTAIRFSDTANTVNYLTIDGSPNAVTAHGILKAGTTPTTLTDSAGKILSAALNTVAIANGGTGVTTANTVKAYYTANVAVSNNADTPLLFNSERLDTNNLHDTTTNTGRFTATVAGTYMGLCSVTFASNATGIRYAYLRLNGGATQIAHAKLTVAGTGNLDHLQIPFMWNFAANDYFELVVFQNSGGSLDVLAQNGISPECGMTRVSQ